MKCFYKIFFLIFLTCSLSIAFCQEEDSLRQIGLQYDSILNSDIDFLDILFYKHKNDILINNQGPYGSMAYYPTVRGILSNKTFVGKRFNSSLQDLQGIKPFTNIKYINASRKEQLFSVSHVQQFGKLVLLEFDYRRISSPGEYLNQEANFTGFDAAFNYKNRKDSYSFLFETSIKRNRNEENGGLTNPEDFQNQLFDSKINHTVNLTSSNLVLKDYSYQMEQRLKLFSLSNDSSKTRNVYLGMLNQYVSNERVFSDNDPLSEIYTNIFIDSVSTVDSIYHNKFITDLSLQTTFSGINISFLGSFERVNYSQLFGIDTSYNNIYTGLNAIYNQKKISSRLDVKYGLSGYRKGDVLTSLESNYFINDKTNILIDIGYYRTEPDLNYVFYTSNHFSWNNTSFKKQDVVKLNTTLQLKKWRTVIKVENKLLNNSLYFDSLALANQNNDLASISTFSIAKDYSLSNFHFRTVLKYQITSDRIIFPLPNIVGRQLMYYEKSVFKKALKIQLGFGLSYTSDYYGYAYMPALTEFYVQDHTLLGSYPNFDVFINTHLKRAQIFLKYEHVNSGSRLDRAYSVLNYPLLGRSFKFGISWNLFD